MRSSKFRGFTIFSYLPVRLFLFKPVTFTNMRQSLVLEFYLRKKKGQAVFDAALAIKKSVWLKLSQKLFVIELSIRNI